MAAAYTLFQVTVLAILRDRVLHALLAVALLMFTLVPVFSLFSMRQVQELAISLSLSCISLTLLVFTVLLGASSIWRDVERRYTAAILSLPLSRKAYMLGKFCGIALFLLVATGLLAGISWAVITLSAGQYPSERPIHWANIMIAIGGDALKYFLLLAFALLLSTLSTSFFLPIFGTVAIFLAGSASQEVHEYMTGSLGQEMSVTIKALVNLLYYVVPNFAAFDFKVQAIYALPIETSGLILSLLYGLIYIGIVLTAAVAIFERRELR